MYKGLEAMCYSNEPWYAIPGSWQKLVHRWEPAKDEGQHSEYVSKITWGKLFRDCT